jgi:effector-binding domain-containing protein
MSTLMKVLKWVLILIAAIFIIGFFLPSKVHVDRSIDVKASPATISSIITDFKQWSKWSPWDQLDPNMKKEFFKGGAGVGSAYTWESQNKNVGKGKMTMLEVTPDFIKTKLEFDGMGASYPSFNLKQNGDMTKVTWNMDSDGEGVPFLMKPISRIFGLFMDKMIAPDFEKGLKSIKEVAESMPPGGTGKVVSIEVATMKDLNVCQTETTCKIEDIGKNLGEMYGKIGKKIGECGLRMDGMPMAMYPGINKDSKETKVVAMVPTNNKCMKDCSPEFKCHVIPGGKYVKAAYEGPYEGNMIAYEAIQKYMAENKLTANGEPFEGYANDPMEVKDPAKYLTIVYWPVK